MSHWIVGLWDCGIFGSTKCGQELSRLDDKKQKPKKTKKKQQQSLQRTEADKKGATNGRSGWAVFGDGGGRGDQLLGEVMRCWGGREWRAVLVVVVLVVLVVLVLTVAVAVLVHGDGGGGGGGGVGVCGCVRVCVDVRV